jgi:hypothetical protein
MGYAIAETYHLEWGATISRWYQKGQTMEGTDKPSTRKDQAIHWAPRILGSIVVGFWLLSLVMGVRGGGLSLNAENMIMLVLILASTVAFLVAWSHERPGGIMLLVVGLAHSIFAYFAAGRNKAFAIMISGVPFLVLGALFLGNWSRSRRTLGASLNEEEPEE